MPKISVLEQSIATVGRPNKIAISNAIELGKHCERLGYERFWVSEHHNSPTIVGTAPEILIAAIATATKQIRVGSAGVMLPHYSAFKVAEQFRVLDALAPGRIDLGLGRAPGSDGRTAFALNPLANERPAQFPSDVRDLMAWVAGQPLPDKHPFGSVQAFPQGDTSPEIWILGSSNYGAQVAAHFGLPYCFAWFFTDGQGAEQALDIYRETFQPTEQYPKPHAALCVWALASSTNKEAQFHYSSRVKWRLFRERGIFLPIEPPDVAAAYEFTGAEKDRIRKDRADAFVGTGEKVAGQIQSLAIQHDIEEIAIVTWAHDEKVRRESYELLAKAFDLSFVEQ